MLALKILGGTAMFALVFIWVGVVVGKLAEKHHTLMAFLFLFAGLAVLITLTMAYGHAVR